MSGPLAIAAVTAALADLLDNGLIAHDVAAKAGNVSVSARAPSAIKLDGIDIVQINLFMYMVTPNAAWRNAALPARDNNGSRMTNPPLALNLHYMLTAYGKDDFQAEILLGYAMQLLHETPILSRDALRQSSVLSRTIDGPGGPLAKLEAANLAEQIEQIKIVPEYLNAEELSKLWSAFQAPYRPSAAYQASVVLIEGTRPTRAPLPVRQRIIQVQLGMPLLTAIELPNRQSSARLGDTLGLHGSYPDADTISVQCVHPRLSTPISLRIAEPATGRLELQLSKEQKHWAAGLYGVTVQGFRNGRLAWSTNTLPLALAPTITGVQANKETNDDREVISITIISSPPVLPEQRVSLLLGERELPVSKRSDNNLVFEIGDIPKGKYHIRLRVDGVDSLLIDASNASVFDPSQQVEIPQ